jgi:hypothetical protein
VQQREGEIRGLFKDILEKRKTIKTQSGQPVTRLKFDGGVGTKFISTNLSEKDFVELATYLNIVESVSNGRTLYAVLMPKWK